MLFSAGVYLIHLISSFDGLPTFSENSRRLASLKFWLIKWLETTNLYLNQKYFKIFPSIKQKTGVPCKCQTARYSLTKTKSNYGNFRKNYEKARVSGLYVAPMWFMLIGLHFVVDCTDEFWPMAMQISAGMYLTHLMGALLDRIVPR